MTLTIFLLEKKLECWGGTQWHDTSKKCKALGSSLGASGKKGIHEYIHASWLQDSN